MTSDAPAFFVEGEDRPSNIIVTCDHASNRVPAEVNGGSLGLPDCDMNRHIAYDVGAAGVSRALAERLDGPAVLSNFSRLVIDPNRGEDDPTLVMQLYDGSVIPANRAITAEDFDWRLTQCYRPYHAALARVIAARSRPILVAMHSFTPQLAGRDPRPWHIGILHEKDQRLAKPMLARLRREPDLCVGENEPYGGHLDGDSIDRHALVAGHPNILIEIRNDLIATADQQVHWAHRLAPIIAEVIDSTPL